MSKKSVSLPKSWEAYAKIIHNPDGTLTLMRLDQRTPPQTDLTLSVLTKDVTLSESNNTWIRIFLPRKAIGSNNQKLPLIVFFHGGGFILLSAASTIYHDFCLNMADEVGAVVASIEYRNAPEHRLPAAYDDAVEALHWIRKSKDEWLTQYVDYSDCYIMGHSAGGNIAYNTALRAAAEDAASLEPLKIQGLILRQPFFGGTNRTDSELRYENDLFLPLSITDLMWDLALPQGVNRDHEYCNLWTKNGSQSQKLDKIRELGWKVLVSGNGGDPLVDRGMEVLKLMEERGVHVVNDFDEEGGHAVEWFQPIKGRRLNQVVKAFISSTSNNAQGT